MHKRRVLPAQLIGFAIVSMISTGVDYSLLAGLHHYLPVRQPYLLTTVAISYASGVLVHFLLTRRYIFAPSHLPTVLELSFVICIGVIGLLLTEAFIYACMACCGMHLFLAKGIAVCLVFGWNFIARRRWVYPLQR